MKKIMHGFVDVFELSQRKIPCCVDIVNNDNYKLYLYLDDNIIKNSNTFEQFESFKPLPIKGVLKETINDIDKPISNAKVSFIKDYVVDSDRTGYKTIVDYCVTNNNGEYTVFITPGTYTIKVHVGGQNVEYINQTIEKGLTTSYYIRIEGLIYKQYEDIIEFVNCEKKLIQGKILDKRYNKPIKNCEIIITSKDNLISYVKTNNEGNYSFALENGIYDIRIRAKNYSVKIINNFVFENNKGFISQLNEQTNLFRGDDLIWIYE